MAYDSPGSLQLVRLRIARLNTDGSPMVGTKNAYVTDQMIKLTPSPQYTDGDTFSQPNGAGANCIDYKDDDTLQRVDVTLEICTPDPEFTQLLMGGVLLTDPDEVGGPTTVGYAMPALGKLPDRPISIEAWTKAVAGGAQVGTLPYHRFVFPRTRSWRLGDRELSNTILATSFTGQAVENPNFGNGPFDDWQFTNTERVMAHARDDVLPSASIGTIAVPVQVP
jgi:hypothetical protein